MNINGWSSRHIRGKPAGREYPVRLDDSSFDRDSRVTQESDYDYSPSECG